MSVKSTFICDGCGLEVTVSEAQAKDWIFGGRWFSGHGTGKVEIYLIRDDEADPDQLLHWCGPGCITRFLVELLTRDAQKRSVK